MNELTKRERLKQKIESHLRDLARQLVKFDTLEETLHYLMDSFWMDFTSDFVAILLKEGDQLIPKVWRGETLQVKHTLHLTVDPYSRLLQDALWWPNESGMSDSDFRKALENEKLSTWFTVPLKEREKTFGICIIGFRNFVPLIVEAENYFVEFGRDVAVAMELARDKERQKRKIKGMEWLRENIFPGTSIEHMVEKMVDRAGKGTMAAAASIFLYDEKNNCLIYQPPSYGTFVSPDNMVIDNESNLSRLFPYFGKAGGEQLTVPLVVNLKTIGILHVSGKQDGVFTEDDLELLEFLSTHVSMQIENARLVQNEQERRLRLQNIMIHQQELVKKTIEEESLYEITRTVSSIFGYSVFLFDRLLRLLSHHAMKEEQLSLPNLLHLVKEHEQQIRQIKSDELWLQLDEGPCYVCIWPIIGGGRQLGYLAVFSDRKYWDDVLRLTVNNALNVYAIEFIKQKLVMDTREQVKESFMNQLFSEKIEDPEKVVQYTTFINWNVYDSHRVAYLSVKLDMEVERESDLIGVEEKKSRLWDIMKMALSNQDQGVILTRKGDEFILISRVTNEQTNAKAYWQSMYQQVQKIAKAEMPSCHVYLGVGGRTERMEDYYFAYKQAVQTANLIRLRYPEAGFAIFEEFESYSLLHQLTDHKISTIFVQKKLAPLLRYTEGSGADLFQTLRIYLSNNGSMRETSEALYIHRSTLQYRLDKIREILQIDIEQAEQRFSLLMAYKLYDLLDLSPPQIC
ncbi:MULTISPECIES: helix-turn-helix domain-containing protein [Paenibacillus]|uniref:helix-turn-helix domain-containing protein n=1 Tax=Paenibacillus TaxID=44249 RepID=UPI001915AD46|nr:helix-turn-helix domain-containing protein [Paenibacillus sp. EPM92]